MTFMSQSEIRMLRAIRVSRGLKNSLHRLNLDSTRWGLGLGYGLESRVSQLFHQQAFISFHESISWPISFQNVLL
jgi:hypothetical protein